MNREPLESEPATNGDASVRRASTGHRLGERNKRSLLIFKHLGATFLNLKHMRTTIEPKASSFFGKRTVLSVERPKGWACRLESKKRFVAFGEKAGADEPLEAIRRLRPDLVLLRIPGNGRVWLQLLRRIRAAHSDLKILAICECVDPAFANRVLLAGANGCVVDGEIAGEIAEAARDVMAGGFYLSEVFLTAMPESTGKTWQRGRQNPCLRRALKPVTRRCEQQLVH
jgi:DNA-binding NarL/FixJ family response regulator